MTVAPQKTSAAARSVLIIQNPKAGSRSGRPVVERLAELLRKHDLLPEVLSDLDQFSLRLKQSQDAGQLKSVVAAGGDGTVSLTVNHTPPQVPIAICPLGTENLLSRQLGLSADPEDVCAIVCGGRPIKLDAGQANGRLFLLMAGCGFDGEVVRRLHGQRTGHIRHWSYAKPIIDSIRSYQYPKLRVYCDPLRDAGGGPAGSAAGRPRKRSAAASLTARWVFVVNLPRYAGGLQIAPHASGCDGLLDVCTFKQGSLLNGLKYLAGVVLGRHQQWDDFATQQAARLRIEADEPVPYQLDGDPGGMLPVEIQVLPAHATVLVPPDSEIESAS